MLNSRDMKEDREGGFNLGRAPGINWESFNPGAKAVLDSLPELIKFEDWESVDSLDFREACEVVRAARRMLLIHLIGQETHEHMLDDCGDYLTAATDNWNYLHGIYFNNDGDEAVLIAEVKKFLKAEEPYAMGGCDGDIRFDILTEAMLDQIYQ